MLYYYANNASTVLQIALGSASTSMVVASVDSLPVSTASTPAYYTLQSGGLYEVIKVPVRSGSSTTITIERAQEGTTALNWAAGTVVSLRATAGGLNSKQEMGTGSTLTIASGVINLLGSYHLVDTEASAASDDLDTINNGVTGQIIVLQAVNGSRDVVLKDGTGNLKLAGDFTLDNVEDTITLICRGSTWYELSRSDNGS